MEVLGGGTSSAEGGARGHGRQKLRSRATEAKVSGDRDTVCKHRELRSRGART